SIGVAAFGAIFTNRLGDELAARLPRGARVPTVANPAVIHALPPPLHRAFVDAFAVSLRPVFLAAAGISLAAFLLTWWLPEVPLRGPAAAQGVGESFASPRAADSDRELERIATRLMEGDERNRAYQAAIARSGVRDRPGRELGARAHRRARPHDRRRVGGRAGRRRGAHHSARERAGGARPCERRRAGGAHPGGCGDARPTRRCPPRAAALAPRRLVAGERRRSRRRARPPGPRDGGRHPRRRLTGGGLPGAGRWA